MLGNKKIMLTYLTVNANVSWARMVSHFFSSYRAVNKVMTREEHVHELFYALSPLPSMLKRATFTKRFHFSYQLTAACFNWPSENHTIIHCLLSLLSTSIHVCFWAKRGSGTFKFCKNNFTVWCSYVVPLLIHVHIFISIIQSQFE